MECRASMVSHPVTPRKSARLQMPTAICADRLVPFGKIQVAVLPSRCCRKLTKAEYAVTSANSAVARYGSIIRVQNQPTVRTMAGP